MTSRREQERHLSYWFENWVATFFIAFVEKLGGESKSKTRTSLNQRQTKFSRLWYFVYDIFSNKFSHLMLRWCKIYSGHILRTANQFIESTGYEAIIHKNVTWTLLKHLFVTFQGIYSFSCRNMWYRNIFLSF